MDGGCRGEGGERTPAYLFTRKGGECRVGKRVGKTMGTDVVGPDWKCAISAQLFGHGG